MLERLTVEQVGPADGMDMEPVPRWNIITGDNGPGKLGQEDTVR